MRSWKKLALFDGTSSKFLFETIKSIQRMMLAPKIIIPAEVNGDTELPDQILRQLIMFYIFYL